MNEIRTLFEKFWISKDSDKETYYKVKRDIPNFQKFVREQLGWKLVHTENLLKLEKIPAIPEKGMGIEEFSSKEVLFKRKNASKSSTILKKDDEKDIEKLKKEILGNKRL